MFLFLRNYSNQTSQTTIWPWLCCYFKANEQIQRENFGKNSFVSTRGGWLMDAVTGRYLSSRPGQRDHRLNGRRAAGGPAHQRAARGNRFMLDFLSCRRLGFSCSSIPDVIEAFPVFVQQAEKARSLGAIVYCVGVKDFNETQVKPLPVPRIPAASDGLTCFPYVLHIWFTIQHWSPHVPRHAGQQCSYTRKYLNHILDHPLDDEDEDDSHKTWNAELSQKHHWAKTF